MSGCREIKIEKCIFLGEVISISADIYQPINNNSLSIPCKQNKDTLVVPIEITLDNLLIEVFNNNDFSAAVISDTPTETDIMIGSDISGYKLSYTINTTTTPLNVAGNYTAVFSYEVVETGEIHKIVYKFTIKTIESTSKAGCC